jgi:hypothetical protein
MHSHSQLSTLSPNMTEVYSSSLAAAGSKKRKATHQQVDDEVLLSNKRARHFHVDNKSLSPRGQLFPALD